MTNPFKKKKEVNVETEELIKPCQEDGDYLKEIKKVIHEREGDEKIPFYPPVADEPKKTVAKKPATHVAKTLTQKPKLIDKKMTKENYEGDPALRVKKLKEKARTKKDRKYFDWNRGLVFLSVLAIMGIIFLYQMVSNVSMPLAMILMMFGMLCFLPLGLLLGKLFLDPYVRCKIMRRVRGKNYGMVYFVHKGGQRVDIKIKNLDDDVVVQGTKLWVLEKGSIYYIDREDNLVLHVRIEADSVVTSPNNVPILFLDPENMVPLRFHETETKSNPQQVGSVTLGYINNQIAKNLFFKRSMQTFYIMMLMLQAVNICGLIILYDALVGI